MAVARKKPAKDRWFADKKALMKLVEVINAEAGFVYDPTATPEKVREMMLAEGIRPEDNILSCDIIRAKYPEDEERE